MISSLPERDPRNTAIVRVRPLLAADLAPEGQTEVRSVASDRGDQIAEPEHSAMGAPAEGNSQICEMPLGIAEAVARAGHYGSASVPIVQHENFSASARSLKR